MGFRDAVGNLKHQGQDAEKNSWVAPVDRKDRDNEPGENELGKYDPEVSYDDENDLDGRYRENDQEVTSIRGDGERNDCEHNDHEGCDGEENVQAEEDLDDEFGLRALQRRGFA